MTTGPDGEYNFPGLAPGTFGVKFTSPAPASGDNDFQVSNAGSGDDQNNLTEVAGEPTMGTISGIVLGSGTTSTINDGGFFQPASLGDTVFNDANNNGIQDAGEAGLAGVAVQLLDGGGNPIAGVAPITTGTDGTYLFTDLTSGDFQVRLTAPSGSNFVVSTAGNGDSQNNLDGQGTSTGIIPTVTLGAGESNLTRDGGFFSPGSIGNQLFVDVNGDGIFDPSVDQTISGTVTLQDQDGNPIVGVDPITTGADGTYNFGNLPAGDYKVSVDIPAATVNGAPVEYLATINPAGDLDGTNTAENTGAGQFMTTVVTIATGESNTTLDVGVFLPASLGDLVFEDSNNNGIQDAGEEGIEGVLVELLDENMDSIDSDLSTSAIEPTTTTTLSDGTYAFTGLAPGTYFVQFEAPAGNGFTSQNQLADDTLDSDVDADGKSDSVTLVSGENNDTIDAGIVTITYGLGNLVYIDNNSNGFFDSADTRVGNVSLSLFSVDDLLTPVQTTSTDSEGRYLFDGLPEGKYIVRVDSTNFDAPSDPLWQHNVFGEVDGDLGVDDNAGQNGRVSPAPDEIGVFSNVIMLGPDAEPSDADTETGDDADSDNANETTTDLTVDFGFRVFEVEPQGCFYVAGTGEVIPGGSITVQRVDPDNGNVPIPAAPGEVIILDDGSDGCFSWFVVNSEGRYCATYTAPSGFQIDPATPAEDAAGSPAAFDPGAGINGVLTLGSLDADDDGFLDDGATSANPYYFCFDLSNEDPLVTGVNIPLVRATTFEEWVNSLVPQLPAGEAGPLDDPDGDGISNVLEYALGLNPSGGLKVLADGVTPNNGFAIVFNGAEFDAQLTRPAGITDITYTLEFSSDGSNFSDAGITPITPTATGLAGTEIVTFPNVSEGLFRIRVQLDGSSPLAEDVSFVNGWQNHTVQPFCESFAYPYLNPCLFIGTVDSVSGNTVDVASSLQTGNLTQLDSTRPYYIEVVTGSAEGCRFDVVSFTDTGIILAVDNDLFSNAAPFNTTLTVPDLSGMRIILREHFTFATLFPADDESTPGVDGFVAGSSVANSGRLHFWDANNQVLTTYFLQSAAASGLAEARWVDATNPTVSLNDNVVPPGLGIFTHNFSGDNANPNLPSAAFEAPQFGEVRTNRARVPLAAGHTLVPAMYPLDQNFTDRALDSANGAIGSTIRQSADQVQFWRDDNGLAASGGVPHLCYDARFFFSTGGVESWVLSDDVTLSDRTAINDFQSDRSALYCIQGPNRENYSFGSPIVSELP